MGRDWRDKLVTPEEVVQRIKPGMTIFLGSGLAEPRTLMKGLMESQILDNYDLEMIQLTRHSDYFSLNDMCAGKYRLKTFFSSWVSSEAILSGSVDLIPARISQLPKIIKSNRIPIDVAFIQVAPPDHAGYCSLGVAVDLAREAMDRAKLVVAEINPEVPYTFGDTIVSIFDFDFAVNATEPPTYYKRRRPTAVIDRVAANIAHMIRDGDCVSFLVGPLYEALGRHLAQKRDLGVHTPYFSDAMMELVKSGAVTNYRKPLYRGKSVTSYAMGTPALMQWLDRNPLVEFQGVEQVFDPVQIGRIPNFVVVSQAQKVDLLGRVAFPADKDEITSGPGKSADLFAGAEMSPGGRNIIGLPSRTAKGKPNIIVMLRSLRNQFNMREAIDAVVTEYGIANLKWRTIRERAQALIDIAHPEDRKQLVAEAKAKKLLFKDQIFLSDSARFYPQEAVRAYEMKNGMQIRFRPIKPSDEEAMRHFFYRFSKKSIYSRFFFPISTMPHDKLQAYVNVDYSNEMSVVALVNEPGQEIIIAEARYARDEESGFGDLGFFVDEQYQGMGVALYLYDMLQGLARERGLLGFTAEVLHENKGMLKVLEKGGLPVEAVLRGGIYELKMPFDD
jgi:acyl-CoA hydrolase/GNAT superfamily N-acetyltransferase